MLSKKKLAVLMAVVVFIMGMAIGSFGNIEKMVYAQDAEVSNELQNSISVNGQAMIDVVPDVAYLTMAVKTFNKNAETAQDENAKKMQQVYTKLYALGINKADIKTSNYSIYPRYEWKNTELEVQPGNIEKRSERILVGYDVSNQIKVTIKDFEKISKVIDTSVEAGVNENSSLYFGITEATKNRVYIEALKDSVENAEVKAQAIASVYKIELEKPYKIIEGSTYFPGITPYRSYYAEDTMGMGGYETPISPGEMQIEANVTVIYSY